MLPWRTTPSEIRRGSKGSCPSPESTSTATASGCASVNPSSAFSCAKCPVAPDEMRIRENVKPDLRPIPELEEPPPAVSNVGDLASVMKLWQDRERARIEEEVLYEVDDDRDRRDLPHYMVADPGSLCSDCGEMFGEEDPACYCDYCQAVVCETCRETHRCTVPG